MADLNRPWRDLLLVRTWTPLKEVAIEAAALSGTVRRLEQGKYLIVVESDPADQAIGGAYVTMVAWAESDGAVLRAIDGLVESDTAVNDRRSPPAELLPEATASTYASIVAALNCRGESVLESAEYRIAADGAFLHKVVRSSVAAFYFRALDEIAHERPFAITHRIAT